VRLLIGAILLAQALCAGDSAQVAQLKEALAARDQTIRQLQTQLHLSDIAIKASARVATAHSKEDSEGIQKSIELAAVAASKSGDAARAGNDTMKAMAGATQELAALIKKLQIENEEREKISTSNARLLVIIASSLLIAFVYIVTLLVRRKH
jgi:hypothetical protein